MSALLLAVALLFSQLFLVARARFGVYAPDLLVPLATFVALFAPPRRLMLGALVLGWLRALVLLEPVGGQVLCAWGAMATVAALRPQLLEVPRLGFVLGVLLTAGLWSVLAALLSLLSSATLTGGRELVMGALLAVPLSGLAVRWGRKLRPAT